MSTRSISSLDVKTASDLGQLLDAQGSSRMPMDSAALTLPSELQSNVEFVAQHGRTLVPHADGAWAFAAESSAAFESSLQGIDEYLCHYHVAPKPFIWKQSGQDILTKEPRARITLDKTRIA